MANAQQHPDKRRLCDYALGRLPEAQLAELSIHLAHCPACRKIVDSVSEDGFVVDLRKLGGAQSASTRPAETRSYMPSSNDSQTGREFPEIGGLEIIKELGKGGMGVVYLARQISLNRLVAVKMIRSLADATTDDLNRFRTEAKSVAQLKHPNIVEIHEIGQAGKLPFVLMEYVGKESLASKIKKDAMTPRQAAEITAKLAKAIHHAHQKGVIHRDLKPANILLTNSGEPKVSDFGLAKRSDADHDQTRTGMVIGTPSYMSPEQAAGNNKNVTAKSDVYSLGAVLYELLVGRPPFKADSPDKTRMQVLADLPVSPTQVKPKIPSDLETICLKCLEKDACLRYADAQALADDVQRYLEGRPIIAQPPTLFDRILKWAKRNPTADVLIGASIIVILGIVTGFSLFVKEKEDNKKRIGVIADQGEKVKLRLAYGNHVRDADAYKRNPAMMLEILMDTKKIPPELRELSWYLRKDWCERSILPPLKEDRAMVVTFSPDGKTIAVGNVSGKIQLWRPNTGVPIITLPGPPFEPVALAFSPDGSILASAGKSTSICLWKVDSGELLATLRGHTQHIASLTFAPDGSALVSGSWDRTLRQWNVATLEKNEPLVLFTFPAEISDKAVTTCLAYSFDGKRLAVGYGHWGQWGDAFLLNFADAKIINLAKGVSGHAFTDTLGGIAFADKSVLTFCLDGTARRWDPETGADLGIVINDPSLKKSCRLTPDGNFGVLGAKSTVKIVDIKKGAVEQYGLYRHGWLNSLAISPDGKMAASANNDGSTTILNLPLELATLRGHTGSVYGVAISPDGETIASVSSERNTAPLAFIGGGPFCELKLWDRRPPWKRTTLHTHRGGYLSLGFARDKPLLAIGTVQGTIDLWDITDKMGRPLGKLPGHLLGVRSLAIAPDGQTLVSGGSMDSKVRVWDVSTEKEKWEFDAHTKKITAVAFSPDGRWFATASEDKTVKLWKVRDLPEHRTLQGHSASVWAVAFSPDSKTLASGAFDGAVRLWNVDTGEELGKFLHTDSDSLRQIKALAFWPDPVGTTLVVGGGPTEPKRGSLTFWDTVTYQKLLSIETHAKEISGLGFDPENQFMATSSFDGTVKIWHSHRPSK